MSLRLTLIQRLSLPHVFEPFPNPGTPTPTPAPAPAPTPTPTPVTNVTDTDKIENNGNGNANVIGDGTAIGGNNTQEIDNSFNWENNKVDIGGNNYGNIGSDLSVNFNPGMFAGAGQGTGAGGYDADSSAANAYANAWVGIQSNQNRAQRNPNQFAQHYLQGYADVRVNVNTNC